jgi:hypothetical protein
LPTVLSWSAMALFYLPRRVTSASLGYGRSRLLVRGTACTRFKYLLAVLLLVITAGRLLRIWSLIAGSKFTHHTSPRVITDISDGCFRPFESLGFTPFVLSHLLIGGFEVLIKHVWPYYIFDKAANPAATHNSMKPCIHFGIKYDGKLFLHLGSSHILHVF